MDYCDNNTVKTHQSVRLLKKKLGFLHKIFSKNQFFFFHLKANKARWTSRMTKK